MQDEWMLTDLPPPIDGYIDVVTPSQYFTRKRAEIEFQITAAADRVVLSIARRPSRSRHYLAPRLGHQAQLSFHRFPLRQLRMMSYVQVPSCWAGGVNWIWAF